MLQVARFASRFYLRPCFLLRELFLMWRYPQLLPAKMHVAWRLLRAQRGGNGMA